MLSISTRFGRSRLPTIIPRQLAAVPQIVGSIRVSNVSHINQVNPPIRIDAQAPKFEAFFQYRPKVKGAKRQTITSTTDATTKP